MIDLDRFTDLEIAEAFIYSKNVTDPLNRADCNSECEDCSASTACEQLSEGGKYKDFVTNFDRAILPILKELLDEDN